jgi:RNA polymerase sigma factor, sigma-70 family
MIFGLFLLPADDKFALLCKDTYEDIKAYALRLTNGNVQMTEEIVQNTYEVATKNMDKLLLHEEPRGWLFITAKHIYMKEKTKHNIVEANEIELLDTVPYPDNYYEDENISKLKHLLSEMSEKKKRIFIDYHVKKISLKKIADDLGEDYNAIKQMHYRIIKELVNKFGL